MNTYYHLSGEETMREINGSTEPLTEEQIRRYKELYDNVMVITAVKEQPQGTKTEQKKKRGNAHER